MIDWLVGTFYNRPSWWPVRIGAYGRSKGGVDYVTICVGRRRRWSFQRWETGRWRPER